MALCPFATHKIIPAGSSDPPITARAAILHVAASLVASLFEYFRDRSGGIESHFFITITGKLEQYRDTNFQADANLDANNFAISFESAGLGGGKWNARQRRMIQRALLWLRDTEGVPLHKITVWDGTGIGYHTMWGAPSHWTPVAKTCPGPARIAQFNNWLVPWMNSNPTAPDPTRAERRAARRLAKVSAQIVAARADVTADREALQTSRERVKRLMARRSRLGSR